MIQAINIYIYIDIHVEWIFNHNKVELTNQCRYMYICWMEIQPQQGWFKQSICRFIYIYTCLVDFQPQQGWVNQIIMEIQPQQGGFNQSINQYIYMYIYIY